MANISIKGGDKWRKALSRLAQDKTIKVRAGVLEGATNTAGQSVAQYAAYNEFGAVIPVTGKMKGFFRHQFGVNLKKDTIVIPARPFMRRTLENHQQEWINGVAALLKAGRSPEDALEQVGRRMQGDIQAQIMSNMDPENSALTKKIKNERQKGVHGTLNYTGTLKGAINYEVEP